MGQKSSIIPLLKDMTWSYQPQPLSMSHTERTRLHILNVDKLEHNVANILLLDWSRAFHRQTTSHVQCQFLRTKVVLRYQLIKKV